MVAANVLALNLLSLQSLLAPSLKLSNAKSSKPGTAQVGEISKAQKQQKDFSKCQSILFYSTRKTQKLDQIGAPGETLLDFSSILSQIIKKIGGRTLWWFFKKCLTMPKLHLNFENVISKLWKRYIRAFKTLYANFENFISELWKR